MPVEIGSALRQLICPFSRRELAMVISRMGSSHLGSTNIGSTNTDSAPGELERKTSAPANCGPMTQQGAMGAHGHQMHPQGFLRLIGCYEAGRQKQDVAQQLHA
jgi:hypothetical protein